MRVKGFTALMSVIAGSALAACSDSTAPVSEPQPSSQLTSFSRGYSNGATGSLAVVAAKPVTLPFATVDCNGQAITGTSTHYALVVAASSTKGTFNLAGAFDIVNAVGTTSGVKYTGSNLVVSASLLTPDATVFFTDLDFDLRPNAKGLKDTYLDIVTYYVSTPNGPVLSNAVVKTKCQATGESKASS